MQLLPGLLRDLKAGMEIISVDANERATFLAELDGNIRFTYERLANLGYLLYVSTDLKNWTLWDVPGNYPDFSASTAQEDQMSVQSRTTSSPTPVEK